jgi:ribosomal protein RSM22 (predicted rRNA methylase)
MDFSLPPALAAALDGALDGVSRKDLAARAAAQTAAYRSGGTSRPIASDLDALAYALARMPATFAANAAVFARLVQAMPDFAPASLLDVGAGPGTASWAALAAWPAIAAVTMRDHNPALRALARRLTDAGPLAGAEIVAGDAGEATGKADLAVASYVLAEMPDDDAARLARRLWQQADRALVLIEPGTPAGFARIRAARAALIEAGAHVAAPCTHDNMCPMAESIGASRSDNQISDWCHFSQRLPRSRDHMRLKDASVPFEDERYAYVAVTREPMPRGGARMVAPPLEAKPGLTFRVCDESGLSARFVPARDRVETRRVRRKGWGDLF